MSIQLHVEVNEVKVRLTELEDQVRMLQQRLTEAISKHEAPVGTPVRSAIRSLMGNGHVKAQR